MGSLSIRVLRHPAVRRRRLRHVVRPRTLGCQRCGHRLVHFRLTVDPVTRIAFIPACVCLVAAAGFIVNAHWYVLSVSERSDLAIGYFLWWCSFALLAVGLFDLSRQGAHGYPVPQNHLGAI